MLFTCCCMVVVVAVTAPTPSTWCQDLESSETVAWIQDGRMDPGRPLSNPGLCFCVFEKKRGFLKF